MEGWKNITARIAITGREPVSFAIDAGEGGQPQKRSTLLLDPATGAVVRWENHREPQEFYIFLLASLARLTATSSWLRAPTRCA